MIIFVLNQKITGYMPNENLTEERKEEILTTNPYAIWVDEEINYPDSTKQYEMYYRDGVIVYEEVEPIEPPHEPTNAEIYENQMIIMSALADLYETSIEGGMINE